MSRMPPPSSCSHVFPSRLLSPTLMPRCFFTCCLRCDITAILLFVEHLMWSVCEHPEDLVPSCPQSSITTAPGGSDWPRHVHSLCEDLLTVLVIVTAPLSLLYRFVQTDTIDLPNMYLYKNSTCFLQDVCDGSRAGVECRRARQAQCPLAGCHQPRPLHRADRTVR